MLRNRVPARRLARILTSETHYSRDPEGFMAWVRDMDPAGPLAMVRQMRAILNHAADDRLGQIGTKTLILTGDNDLLVPVENSRTLARAIGGARLVEFPGVGHCFPVEKPDEVANALQEFFATS